MIRMGCIFLFLLIASYTFAQNGDRYQVLKQYHRFGITVGPALYNKGKIDPEFGSYTFENFNTLSFNAGFEFDFHPEKLFSFQLGCFVGYEPVSNIRITVPKEDLPLLADDDLVQKWKTFGHYSISIPMTVSIKKRIANKLYGQLKTGLRLLNYAQGSASGSISVADSDSGYDYQVFGLRARTGDTKYYGSFILGGGVSWMSQWFLLKTNLLYYANFQPIMAGEYRFGNLLESEPSGGLYELSGNYFALMFTFHLNRPKHKYE